MRYYLILLFLFLSEVIFAQNAEKKLLPQIKYLQYFHAETFFEKVFPKNKTYEDSLIKFLKYYDKKLGNIRNYEVYYIDIKCEIDSTAKCVCNNVNPLSGMYGVLILYDPLSKNAKVINVLYNFLSDSETYEMYWESGKENNIVFLQEQAMIGGESDENGIMEVEEHIGRKHRIEILPGGKISITQIKQD
jgi:hypothetical protein